jgi:hypothetical protein
MLAADKWGQARAVRRKPLRIVKGLYLARKWHLLYNKDGLAASLPPGD